VRTAVVGHIEWIDFASVDHVPTRGEIIHADDTFAEPAGGGAVAAVQLFRLSGDAVLFTALGDDDLGHRSKERLEELGVRVEATFKPTNQRRGFTFLDATGERTITVMGDRLGPSRDDPLPWDELSGIDAVYFTAGDQGSLEAARQAGVVVASSRVMAELVRAHVALDAVVGSARDPSERYDPGALHPPPELAVLTESGRGGAYRTADGTARHFDSAPLPGPVADAYGCGDSFAAGLTFGLGKGLSPEEAVALAARCGATCLTGRGPYGARVQA
jgi:ribokinase